MSSEVPTTRSKGKIGHTFGPKDLLDSINEDEYEISIYATIIADDVAAGRAVRDYYVAHYIAIRDRLSAAHEVLQAELATASKSQ